MIQEAIVDVAQTSSSVQCPNCGRAEVEVFYTEHNVPVHSVLLMLTRVAALQYPRRDIKLGFCRNCTFVSNLAFDATAHSYSPQCYEETQRFSATFQAFHRGLVESLVEKHNVRQKHVVEIGCGEGEFLSLLCEVGNNTGVGFDPAFVPEGNSASASCNVKFIQDFYTEGSSGSADFICCKMTLEHIADTHRFVQTVRNSIRPGKDTLVFFQVPDFGRILRDNAFWDVYYEHCSYFTEASLKYLFERCGFEVLSTEVQYEGQYLQIFARPAEPRDNPSPPSSETIASAQEAVRRFGSRVSKKIRAWNDLLQDVADMGRRIVLWGSGSKAVAFLTAMKPANGIEYAVDINPYRHNHYLPGTGQRIVSPEFLAEYKPEIVIAMNPIYGNEIGNMLQNIGCTARLLTV